MEDYYDTVPVSLRVDRLGRMRDLIMQIEADHEQYSTLMKKVEQGISDEYDMEELYRTEAWLRRNLSIYKKLNSTSIEGVTSGGEHL